MIDARKKRYSETTVFLWDATIIGCFCGGVSLFVGLEGGWHWIGAPLVALGGVLLSKSRKKFGGFEDD